jgi:hypothetical protein
MAKNIEFKGLSNLSQDYLKNFLLFPIYIDIGWLFEFLSGFILKIHLQITITKIFLSE